ncbi:acyl-CoA thioesterase [Massilia putida]|uniref:acyl-CoA thioesterase n=1 Tax=Massilia putida TaxID=1141883 RepID=UPI0009F99DBD|nr:acyl-CoA thioesterase domain-containing protein [Massilia putida]
MMTPQRQEARPRWAGLDVAELLALAAGDGVSMSRFNEDNRNGRVFGGQLLGQCLLAAQASVPPGRPPTVLQALFAHGARADEPISYRVDPLQDGKRFSGRRVEATQGGRIAVSAHVTFQEPAGGISHELPPHRPVPPPEQLLSMDNLQAGGALGLDGFDWSWFQKPCLELRVVDPASHLPVRNAEPLVSYWLRLRKALPDNASLHAAALAYLSDYWINTAAITHHVPASQVVASMYVASLNHTLWLHRPCRADDWLLFSTESPSTQGERDLTKARIYDRHGMLVASAAQECLFAPRNSS